MKHVKISESDNPSKERIWDKMYQCRDFELSHFWQKAAFLFGFLTMCFGGYGALVLQVVDKDTNSVWLPYIYQYMCGISLLGIVLSVVWIYMMKGSKAWYEVYEKSIYAIEREIFQDNQQYVEGEFAKRIRGDFDTHLFGTKGGAFSPSRINIVIGWIILFVWCGCLFFSVYNLLLDYDPFELHLKWDNVLTGISFVVVFIILMPFIIRHFIKSTPLIGNENDKVSIIGFVKYLITPLIEKLSSCALCVLFVSLLVCCIIWCSYAILLWLIPITCLVIWLYDKYQDFKTITKKEEIKKEIDKHINNKIHDFSNESLKNQMKDFLNKGSNNTAQVETKIDANIEKQIKKSTETIITDIINDNIDVILSRLIDAKITDVIGKKIDEIVKDKVDSIQGIISSRDVTKKHPLNTSSDT